MNLTHSLLGSAVRAGLERIGRGRLPELEGERYIYGLLAPVEVLRDRWGVPHIYAENEHDLFFTQGFVHAQERLWQMDFQRRLVAGRLAEVLGAPARDVDRWMRTLRMRAVAEAEAADVAAAHTPAAAAAKAYVAGVNAYLAQDPPLPVEFRLLGYAPEVWRLADSLGWVKMVSWTLSVNWEAELLRAKLIDRLGPERAAELEPGRLDRCPYIIPPELAATQLNGYAGLGTSPLDRDAAARPFTGPTAPDGVGSNSWVVAGTRTATGAPLLANDMHLGLTAPAIWIENHLVAGDFNITGITFPGTPGIVSGHNGHVAWGFTNGFADVQDLYMERLRRTADGRVQAEFRGAWEDVQVVRETIKVKGRADVVEEVVVTRHGPIINALAPDLARTVSGDEETPLALRWISLEPETMLEALYAMNHARDCAEFREATRLWTSPIENMVYADTAGTIAYALPGRIPVRAQGDGRVPVPGWSGEYEWTGYVPFEELPYIENPPEGYIATANNNIADDGYPHILGHEYCAGDRAQRIVELLTAAPQVDIAYVQRMHLDQVSPTGRWMAGYLGNLSVDDTRLQPVVELMRGWDGTLSPDSAAAAVYETFMRAMIRLLLRDKLGDLAIRYAGKGPTPLIASASMFGEQSWAWLVSQLEDPDPYWFDLGESGAENGDENAGKRPGARRDDCARRALRTTVDVLTQHLGPDPDRWAWGKLHTLTFHHILGMHPLLRRTFSRGPFPVGGDNSTLWATSSARHTLKSDTLVGPVYRMIVDLGDVRNARGLLTPGNSGHIAGPHYDDQIAAWYDGDDHPMLYTRDAVAAETEHRLELKP